MKEVEESLIRDTISADLLEVSVRHRSKVSVQVCIWIVNDELTDSVIDGYDLQQPVLD